MPGGADRTLSTAARVRTMMTIGVMLGGLSVGALLIYRTFSRPGAVGTGWAGRWISWFLIGARREL
jgi:mitochondrial Rho GTPase 1